MQPFLLLLPQLKLMRKNLLYLTLISTLAAEPAKPVAAPASSVTGDLYKTYLEPYLASAGGFLSGQNSTTNTTGTSGATFDFSSFLSGGASAPAVSPATTNSTT